MKETNATIYVANDGTKFLSKEDCLSHDASHQVKHFIVYFYPESVQQDCKFDRYVVYRGFVHVAVYCTDDDFVLSETIDDMCKRIVEQFCYKRYGDPLIKFERYYDEGGLRDTFLLPNYKIQSCSEDEFFYMDVNNDWLVRDSEHIKENKVFISCNGLKINLLPNPIDLTGLDFGIHNQNQQKKLKDEK